MTTTPPDAPTEPPASGPRVTRDELRDLARLRRSLGNRRVAGVAGGLGRYLDVDPLVLRVAFVVLTAFGGAGLILYGACWLLVPEEGSERAAVTLDDRSRSIALIIVGVIAAASLVGGAWGDDPWFPWPLVGVGLVAWLILRRRDRPDPHPAPAPTGVEGDQVAAYGVDASTGATASTASPDAPWTPPPAAAPAHVPPPPDPRRRGPVLFGLTLALIALAVGVLGIIDLAGVHVAASAYPATALAVTALMLLVGSVWGRAGGLILLGLVCTVATAGTTIADEFDGEQLRARPTTAADVQDRYRIHAGEIVLDLTAVRNLGALDGRTVDLVADAGHLEVTVPRSGLDVVVDGRINGPGGWGLFRRDGGGVDERLSDSYDGGRDVPTLTIHTTLDVGFVDVHTQ